MTDSSIAHRVWVSMEVGRSLGRCEQVMFCTVKTQLHSKVKAQHAAAIVLIQQHSSHLDHSLVLNCSHIRKLRHQQTGLINAMGRCFDLCLWLMGAGTGPLTRRKLFFFFSTHRAYLTFRIDPVYVWKHREVPKAILKVQSSHAHVLHHGGDNWRETCR